jgi:hypothetical protein
MAMRKHGLPKEANSILQSVVVAKSLKELAATQSALQSFLNPLLIEGSRKSTSDSVTSLSSRFGALLIELLKHTNLCLSRPLDSESLQIYITLTRTALDGLHVIRSALKGRVFEVEVHRYAFLRRLFALRCYDKAAQEAEHIIRCMKVSWGLPPSAAADAEDCSYALPHPAQGQNSESVTLAVGVGIHLLICTLECPERVGGFPKIKRLMQRLDAWFT